MILKSFKVFLAISVLALIMTSSVFSQEKDETEFGVGVQFAFPAYGISGVIDLADNFAAQGIIGAFGDLKTYAGRGIYRFQTETYWNTYGYGMVGAWSYPWTKIDENYNLVEKNEITLGYGAGVGVEYNWQSLSSNLPPIWWNLEIGVGSVQFDEANYDFSTFMFGTGAHFRF